MDLSKVFGAAKSGAKKAKGAVQEAGEGEDDLLDTLEGGGIDVVDSGEPLGPIEGDDAGAGEGYERGEDMLADLERDLGHARSRRKGEDDSLDVDLSEFD